MKEPRLIPQKSTWTRHQTDRARGLLNRAIGYGWMHRGTSCEVCGEWPVEGHHTNYQEPYSVRWLCQKHHVMADRIRKAGIEYSRSLVAELEAKRKQHAQSITEWLKAKPAEFEI